MLMYVPAGAQAVSEAPGVLQSRVPFAASLRPGTKGAAVAAARQLGRAAAAASRSWVSRSWARRGLREGHRAEPQAAVAGRQVRPAVSVRAHSTFKTHKSHAFATKGDDAMMERTTMNTIAN